jgi:YVTN family beta-propeller protein
MSSVSPQVRVVVKSLTRFIVISLAAVLLAAPGLQAASPTVAYVANNFSNSVSVIDVNTGAVFSNIPVGSVPTELAITLNHKYVLVTNQFGGTVSVIYTANNSVIATVPVGNTPVGVAVSPDGKFGYVTVAGENALAVISYFRVDGENEAAGAAVATESADE